MDFKRRQIRLATFLSGGRAVGDGGGETQRIRIVLPQRERLGDVIYGQLLEHIISGRFPKGEKLPTENEFAKMFKVSRPVIRNALLRLQGDGVVVTRQGAGTYVNRRPPRRLTEMTQVSKVAEILRCMEARMGLEAETARFAALRRTPADVGKLELAMKVLRKEFARGSITPDADLAFHRLIAEASKNSYLLGLFDFLAGAIQGAMKVTLGITRKGSNARSQRVIDEHERIFDAIRDADAESAALAVRYHLDQARKRLMDRSREY